LSAKLPPAQLTPLCLNQLHRLVHFSAGESAGEIRCAQAGGATGRGERCELEEVSKQIWDYAELGYHENKSSALLQAQLKATGFSLASGVADEPTAFVASYGQGKPVIAILGEFDALPGLSQKPLSQRSPVVPNAPGHGCGHNLLGSGAALTAVAVKEYMAANHIAGTSTTARLPKRAARARCTCYGTDY
jgi:metal-dependent amidase/aminoacylase/carboxypeptidase family protein